MNGISAVRLSKVPEVTLAFWAVKIAATTLGETGGDAVSMTMNLGYAIGSVIFIGVLVVPPSPRSPRSRFTRSCTGP
jgi:uncharacterized membrane-anchored protein